MISTFGKFPIKTNHNRQMLVSNLKCNCQTMAAVRSASSVAWCAQRQLIYSLYCFRSFHLRFCSLSDTSEKKNKKRSEKWSEIWSEESEKNYKKGNYLIQNMFIRLNSMKFSEKLNVLCDFSPLKNIFIRQFQPRWISHFFFILSSFVAHSLSVSMW